MTAEASASVGASAEAHVEEETSAVKNPNKENDPNYISDTEVLVGIIKAISIVYTGSLAAQVIKGTKNCNKAFFPVFYISSCHNGGNSTSCSRN